METVSNLRDPIEGSSTQEATEMRDKLENRLIHFVSSSFCLLVSSLV